MIRKLVQYQTGNGRVPFREWLISLNDITVRAKIRARLDRLLLGNSGDSKSVGGGVHELRFHSGPGYRIYFGLDGTCLVVLLTGGDKNRQEDDIRQAQEYWQDYLRRRG
ncbi:MAG: type II toxin-antitoxin system RelE/ParE family toxin [Candidatus Omnitrophica bacterium]|nr:type II toxin-antitoxin system RelE/ParE family toxin [Candidatus Omnitrophota bacterium]